MTTRHSHLPARIRALAIGTLIAAGAVTGLAGCNADAQTEYPERTESGTPVAPNDEVTPLPETPSPTPTGTDVPAPVPSSSDDSGTLSG
ncbi:hypothetical protein [Herbiconiux daphne]|uniref:Uncharacterized protein n=1 Tax=Herbiconiux daphne TaxID=2970914 RepID=A0ABT2H6T1_9MICO|nr:hypothetical protein [Herbiconiux daphne]MCS5735618.1 hypothetical protein [Herbiconiux daphne]